MNHKYNHLLAGYWAGVYSLTDRVDLEDAVFSAITPNLFVSYCDARSEPRFVAAGSQVRKALGPVVGRSFSSLFGASDQPLIRKLYSLSWENNEPLYSKARAEFLDGGDCEIEISLFPIRQRDDQITCFMGLFLPLQEVSEGSLSLPLKFVMSQELSDVFTSAVSSVVPFRGKTAWV